MKCEACNKTVIQYGNCCPPCAQKRARDAAENILCALKEDDYQEAHNQCYRLSRALKDSFGGD